MNNIAALAMSEPVRIDARRVEEIVTELGETAAENVIGAALEQLAVAVEELRETAGQGGAQAIATKADRVSRLAWQVGLVSLAGVAVDVAECAERADTTALTATLARLMRVTNQSLTTIWDAPDL